MRSPGLLSSWLATAADTNDLANAKTAVDILSGLVGIVATVITALGTVVTAAAVVIGGVWAYFKFVKGRTFRPHVEIGVSGRWLGPRGSAGLLLAVRLKNIGSGKVELRQEGTGVRLRQPADHQLPEPAETAWVDHGVYEIFVEHDWIEPGETIEDDLLLRLPGGPHVVEAQVRIVLTWQPKNVTVHARRVLPPTLEAAVDEDELAAAETTPASERTAPPDTTVQSDTTAPERKGG